VACDCGDPPHPEKSKTSAAVADARRSGNEITVLAFLDLGILRTTILADQAVCPHRPL
jgi:hypothetical protein